ncbi:kelch-like protein 6 isoform X3 [Stegodyphus dumicola]|uniref:kelch-like protein 6 isoform X3 n=1 Tax=Stegodyphus dumicola TaxID=202533 RepID=UPI0015AD0CC9|nr:kelch-like protein 6 isoform X3 [Stegodyphus dumicola]
MAENSGKSSENWRMHWLSRSCNTSDSFKSFATSKDSGHEQSGRYDIRQRIAHLYYKQLYTDVTFFIKYDTESNSTFYAHKAILAAGSQYFAQMLFKSQDELPEITEPVKQIQISGISPEVFKNIIEFLYTDEIYFDNNTLVMETFLAAKEFEIQPLIDRCVSNLEEIELSKFVVCSILQIATQRKMDALKDRCLSFIQENTGDIIRTEDFMKSPLSVVRTICKLQSLNLTSEIELIIAVFSWAKHQNASSRRVAIEPVLKCLRFLVLETKIFSNLVKDHPDIFTPTEALQIMMYLTNPCKGMNELPSWCNKEADRCSCLKSSVFFSTKVEKHLLG